MKKNIWYLPAFLGAYVLGFLTWYWSFLLAPVFLILVLGFIYLLKKDFTGAILVLFSELLLFSKGNLFHFGPLSLRMTFWTITLGYSLYFYKKIGWAKLTKIFLPLGLLVLASFVLGYFNNGLSDAFSDGNAYLYFLLILPLVLVVKERDFRPRFINWFIVGNIFLASLTLLLLFAFSHGLGDINSALYLFFRKNGLGEITYAGSGFWRIFMQSQVYLLPAFLLTVWKFIEERTRKYFWLSTLFLSAIIVSFSRSFWLGLSVAVLLLLIYKIKNWQKFPLLLLIPLTSLIIVLFVAHLPLGDLSLFGRRANVLTSEAALSSRWKLLPVMVEGIKDSPLWGYGFGKSLWYQTADPRVLEYSPAGWYATYAFEWGYLDMVLKMGVFGLLAYLWAIWGLSRGFKPLDMVCLVSLLVLNIFTPYLNHPLGISYLLVLYILSSLPKSR